MPNWKLHHETKSFKERFIHCAEKHALFLGMVPHEQTSGFGLESAVHGHHFCIEIQR